MHARQYVSSRVNQLIVLRVVVVFGGGVKCSRREALVNVLPSVWSHYNASHNQPDKVKRSHFCEADVKKHQKVILTIQVK